jgi:bacterioferritin
MGTLARSLVGKDVDKLIDMLNKALADEWLAYYQYWIGAKVAAGPMRGAVTMELEEHATEELNHALQLVDRILELGGTPLLSPESWYDETNCGYETPEDPYVEALLEQNIKGEQCAIEVYKELADFTKDIDPLTYGMVLQIMKEEIMHEEDLQALEEDINLMRERK